MLCNPFEYNYQLIRCLLPCKAVGSKLFIPSKSLLKRSNNLLCSRKTSSWTMLWKKLRPAKKQQDNVAKGRPNVAINPFTI